MYNELLIGVTCDEWEGCGLDELGGVTTCIVGVEILCDKVGGALGCRDEYDVVGSMGGA